MTAEGLRAAAAFVSRVLHEPLSAVLRMKVREFIKWRKAADEVWDKTRLKFE